jgi:Holliday junction resolvasome RuvABC ATP-dependent DNA helicase subunit
VAHLQNARSIAARMKREKMPWSDALATLVMAGAASTEGNDETALALLEIAATGFDACDMRVFAAIARRHRGRILGGDEGRALVRAADTLMTAERIAKPARFAAMLAPGFPD